MDTPGAADADEQVPDMEAVERRNLYVWGWGCMYVVFECAVVCVNFFAD
jgi:hypothetical protein